MHLQEVNPKHYLAQYIDKYWSFNSNKLSTGLDKIVPDGCIDIIINLGEPYIIECENMVLKSETAYLAGAITHFLQTKSLAGTNLVGVRFKAATFSCFYKTCSLHEVTNKFIELSAKDVPRFDQLSKDISQTFDAFFYHKLNKPRHDLLPIIETIKKFHGNISVNKLMDIHCTTARTLERNFKFYVGLSPKEFINIMRFCYTQNQILNKQSTKTISEIAFASGYYDLSHLHREIKKYSGLSPSSL